MHTTATDTLNSLLRGELSATETYQQALDKLGDSDGGGELRRLHGEHREAANSLRQHVHRHGGKPHQDSGAWGAFAKAVEGAAKLFGNDAALKALKEGEEHGIKEYEKALGDENLSADARALIGSKLLPQTKEHIPVLDRLMAGLVERIRAEEARPRIQSGAALLVCGYDDDEKFHNNHLEGALSLADFQGRENSISKDRELIFYCA